MNADLEKLQESNKTELERRGSIINTGAPVTEAITIRDHIAVGFGDGTVRFFQSGSDPKVVKAHKGVVFSMARNGDHVLTGGEDGRFLKISSEGDIDEIANFGSRWVDYVASYKDFKVCSSGNTVHIWSKSKEKINSLEHQSTVGGLTFDNKGKRLAVSRYGGVTVWKQNNNKWTSSNYSWKGSHGKVTFSPDGRYLVSSMQENQIHGWRINDKADLAMSGYPAKIKSFTWVGDTPYLVTSGSSDAVCWPFDGKEGPMGRKPVCVANGGKELATFVKVLDGENAVFTGFSDGSVLLSEIDESKKPIRIRNSTGSEVTAIAVSSNREQVLIGDLQGNILLSSLWADN
tara:strand:+ start:329 stop:1366 length:1038 start_codon:yes stop_codon:yes gene_type:complete